MPDAAWTGASGLEDFWGQFNDRFPYFRPSHPGITEPVPSVTVDLAPIFSSERAQFAAATVAVDALALLAMTRVFAPAERLLVLDWQHPDWWFRPHVQAVHDNMQHQSGWYQPHQEAVRDSQGWPVTVFPDGDYYAFLSEDMTAGTFGDPWGQTLSIFGKLAPVLAPMLTAWLPIKRSRQ